MQTSHIFISHASKDDDFVKELRHALESHQLTVWADSRNLRGGDKLAPEISTAIEQARQVIVVVSPDALNSEWVQREVKQALEVEARRKGDGYRVIPLLSSELKPSTLQRLFGEEPVAQPVELKSGGARAALPQILTALGEREPNDLQPPPTPPQKPVEELQVKLSDPQVQTMDGKRRASATAELVFVPSTFPATDLVTSRRFTFTAPLGPIETDELRWYLEEFYRWPMGMFRERAARIEAQLPNWGKLLYDEAAKNDSAKEALNAWRNTAAGAERRFSVQVDRDLPDGASTEDQAAASEAASLLLSLPWELLHDGRGFLFHGKNPVRVRRRLPNRHPQEAKPRALPIRILLVSPRPEYQLIEDPETKEKKQVPVGYIDHRISARPLVEAVESLGELAKLNFLMPPTFAALQAELTRADDAGEAYDVVHFDGHGVYDRRGGLGGLCFEDAKDADKLEARAMELVYAERLAEVMRDHRIPLVFLEACQSAQAETDPTASVAARLLNEGVTSVVAMSHSVLVETAHRFVGAFYGELAQGARVGTAMLAGQRALQTDTYRGVIPGAGELRLQDWFVPVLYQEAQDPRLVSQLPSDERRQLQAKERRISLGRLVAEKERMKHEFVGRSRELLKLERLLLKPTPPELSYAVVRGQGGAGKTTLAVETAQWMVRTGRFRRAAFVSLEHYSDARGVLLMIGQQLLPEAERFHIGPNDDLAKARQPIERALRDYPTLIVVDNCESVLPERAATGDTGDTGSGIDDAKGTEAGTDTNTQDNPRAPRVPRGSTEVDAIFTHCQALLRAHPATRIVFTSREALPAPFHHNQREVGLGALSRADAVELVCEVLRQEGRAPKHDDAGNTPQEITDLVEAVNRHARALTLLAREISRGSGVRATTENLRQLMAELHRRHPNDRENSLYGSVELSLRRLLPDLREQVKALAVFHGGANIAVLGMMLEAEVEAVQRLAAALIEVGLAEAMDYGHLRLDPALPNYLLAQMDAAELPALTARWAEAMRALTRFLYQQFFQDAQLAAQLTLLELPNLLAMLNLAADALPPEEVVNLANSVEELLARLGRPQSRAEAVRVRAAAARRLSAWSHAQFESLRQAIERMLDQGQLPEAYTAAEQLLQRALAADETAYAEAAYDIAMAYFNLGRVLKTRGDAEAALPPMGEAQRRFQSLADAGGTAAERMVSAAIIEAAECLIYLGRYDEAAAAYEEGTRRFEKVDDRRWVAVGKGNLGTVRLFQKRYDEALESFRQALRIFESLGEPGSVAAFWHQIGMAHCQAGQIEQAEQAYRQSLAIAVQQQDRSGEAACLNELGSLYDQMGRLEEAAAFYWQAADIAAHLQDKWHEGLVCGNLAATLIKLQRYDEVRRELLRAIECKKPFGHAAEPWKTWNTLRDLEQATGNAQAAAEARGQAVASYLAYRRAGGESQSNQAGLFALVFQAIQQGTTTEAERQLDELAQGELPLWAKTLVAKLHALLGGDRAPALAADPNLTFDNAVELQLLLESLGSHAS